MAGKRPDYEAFAVTTRGTGREEKTRWTQIGMGWKNERGSISIVLDAVPTNGRLVLKSPRPEDQSDG